ncbi:MAG: Hsp20/alpha crystallin family protein [Vicinamibacterales bacterium]
MPAVLEKPTVRVARDPLALFDRMREEMDRVFEGFPFSRLAPVLPRAEALWMPAIEVQQKNGTFVVKADLPGLKREDVTVEVTEDGLAIKGERKSEFKEEKKDEGYFRTERMYGEFHRFVPLPEGAKADEAVASFKDGVLEVTIPVPKAETPAPKKLPIR